MTPRLVEGVSNAPATVDARELARRMAYLMLGPGRWRAEAHPYQEDRQNWAMLVRDIDGAAISVCVGGWRAEGRITFRGQWPKRVDGRTHVPGPSESITCAATRDPRSLVRELERRLLPSYEARYREACDDVRFADNAAEEALRAAGRIARVLGRGARVQESKARPGEEVFIYGEPGSVYRLRVCPAYRGTTTVKPLRVSFEVHNIDEATAARVLRMLAEADQRKASEP